MEIGPTQGISDNHKVDTAPARTQADSRVRASPLPAAGDSVDLTDGARQLRELQSAVAATPVVDNSRVVALREAIANGSYRVNPQRIADGLLAQDHAAIG
jgi:negative regulator of flagellin synthesis FlgM